MGAYLDDIACTKCGSRLLRIEIRLEAKPIGTWSLSGNQMKTVAEEWPYMVCDGCGSECRGKVDS